MNKFMGGILAGALFLTSSVPAFAANEGRWTWWPKIPKVTVTPSLPSTISVTPTAKKLWLKEEATLGNPVTLEGTGEVKAHGHGAVHYSITNGKVIVSGAGVVAVKGSPAIDVRGYGGRKQIGDWTYYFGKGTLKANGTSYELVGWGQFTTGANGNGKVTFRGSWKIRYHGHNPSGKHIDSITLPSELQSQAGIDANAY
jgi:hypothetical protein